MNWKYLRSAQVLTVALFSVWNTSTYAEEKNPPSEATNLKSVVIYGDSYRTTGTKSDLTPIEAPMSYEVYDSELLNARQVDSVNEALRYVPGVTPESRSTVTIFDQYTIRGFESYRNYYDGLPLQYNGLWNLAPQVDAFATESIEVLKGPTSVLYGSAPPGGMVNQTAKQPLSTNETLVRTRIGTNNLMELGVDSTGPVSDTINYRVIALARQKDGQAKTTKEERILFAPSLTWQASPNTSLNLNMYYQNDPEMVPSTPLPAKGTLYSANYGKLGSDAYSGDKNWADFNREVTMLGYKLNHRVNNNLTFLQNFRHTSGKAQQKNTYNKGLTGDSTLVRSAYFTEEEISGYVVDNQLALSLNAGETLHKILFGIEYQTLDSDVQYGDTLGTGTPSIDLANPNYNQINPATLPVNYYTELHKIDQNQLGIYLQDEIHWDALTLIGGLRHDSYKSTDIKASSYAGTPSNKETRISQEETSARLAAIYKLSSGFAPYLSYAESFEPTSGTDTNTGEIFKATTANQIEAGVKFANAKNTMEITAAFFDIKKQNIVVNTASFSQYTQTGEVQSKGFELAARNFITPDFEVTINYTHLDASIIRNPLDPTLIGNTPIWVADKQASIWATYYINNALNVSGGVRYIGKRQLDAANTDTLPGYTLVDVSATYELNSQYKLGLTISNLADKEYVSACYDKDNCWMGAERSIELNLYASF